MNLELSDTVLHLILPSRKGPLQCNFPSFSCVVTVRTAATVPSVFKGGNDRGRDASHSPVQQKGCKEMKGTASNHS